MGEATILQIRKQAQRGCRGERQRWFMKALQRWAHEEPPLISLSQEAMLMLLVSMVSRRTLRSGWWNHLRGWHDGAGACP